MSDRKRRHREREQEEGRISLDLGLGGIFKGMGNLIEIISEMAQQGEGELTRTGEVAGPGRTRAMYGFTVKMGTGGAPRVERFGNVRETQRGAVVEEEREPMVDVFDEGDQVVVIAEIPGVEENEIKLEVNEDILLLAATNGGRKYRKEVLLPCPVRQETIKSCYRSGVLEVRLRKREQEKAGGER